jgi:spore maturation protein CgeB
VDWSGLDVALAGNWCDLRDGSPLVPYLTHDIGVCCPNDEAVRLYRATKVAANIYRTEAQHDALLDGWAMGPREVELAATGTFFLTQQRGENAEVLPMVPTFDGPDDLGDKVRWWLAHPDQRADVAAKAREAVADRTFVANAGRLLQLAGF